MLVLAKNSAWLRTLSVPSYSSSSGSVRPRCLRCICQPQNPKLQSRIKVKNGKNKKRSTSPTASPTSNNVRQTVKIIGINILERCSSSSSSSIVVVVVVVRNYLELVGKFGLSALCRKLAGAFRPRIPPWVWGPGCTKGESGGLASRRPVLVQARATSSV